MTWTDMIDLLPERWHRTAMRWLLLSSVVIGVWIPPVRDAVWTWAVHFEADRIRPMAEDLIRRVAEALPEADADR